MNANEEQQTFIDRFELDLIRIVRKHGGEGDASAFYTALEKVDMGDATGLHAVENHGTDHDNDYMLYDGETLIARVYIVEEYYSRYGNEDDHDLLYRQHVEVEQFDIPEQKEATAKDKCTQEELDEMLDSRQSLYESRRRINAAYRAAQRESDNGTYECDDDDDNGTIEQEGEEFSATSIVFEKLDFHMANISGDTEIADCDFVECNMSSINANYVRFTRCTFTRCNLDSAKLRKCIFDACEFIGCNLTDADIGKSQFIGSGCERIIALLNRTNTIRGARTSFDENDEFADYIRIDDYDQADVTSADDVVNLYHDCHMTYESAETELYRLGFRSENGKDGGSLYDGFFLGEECAQINEESSDINIIDVEVDE